VAVMDTDEECSIVLESSERDPFFDKNKKNFKLRVETWEFDPEADTPEERAQVEAACQHFYHNRFKAKPCADLLWCFQVLRENNFKQTIPSVTIEDGEEITYQKVTSAIRRGAHHLATLQTTDGHWPAQIVGPLFFLPPLVSTHYSISI
ncbi:Beta-amyrin synthase, partial [Glycine soja]